MGSRCCRRRCISLTCRRHVRLGGRRSHRAVGRYLRRPPRCQWRGDRAVCRRLHRVRCPNRWNRVGRRRHAHRCIRCGQRRGGGGRSGRGVCGLPRRVRVPDRRKRVGRRWHDRRCARRGTRAGGSSRDVCGQPRRIRCRNRWKRVGRRRHDHRCARRGPRRCGGGGCSSGVCWHPRRVRCLNRWKPVGRRWHDHRRVWRGPRRGGGGGMRRGAVARRRRPSVPARQRLGGHGRRPQCRPRGVRRRDEVRTSAGSPAIATASGAIVATTHDKRGGNASGSAAPRATSYTIVDAAGRHWRWGVGGRGMGPHAGCGCHHHRRLQRLNEAIEQAAQGGNGGRRKVDGPVREGSETVSGGRAGDDPVRDERWLGATARQSRTGSTRYIRASCNGGPYRAESRWPPRHTNWAQPIAGARAAGARCVRIFTKSSHTGVLPVASVRGERARAAQRALDLRCAPHQTTPTAAPVLALRRCPGTRNDEEVSVRT